MKKLLVILFIIFLGFGARLFAESVFLKNGSIIEGRIVKENSSIIILKTDKSIITKIPRKSIIRVLYHNKYKTKRYIKLMSGEIIIGYIVAENNKKYWIREVLNSPNESAVLFDNVDGIFRKLPKGKIKILTKVIIKEIPAKIENKKNKTIKTNKNINYQKYVFQASIGLELKYGAWGKVFDFGYDYNNFYLGVNVSFFSNNYKPVSDYPEEWATIAELINSPEYNDATYGDSLSKSINYYGYGISFFYALFDKKNMINLDVGIWLGLFNMSSQYKITSQNYVDPYELSMDKKTYGALQARLSFNWGNFAIVNTFVAYISDKNPFYIKNNNSIQNNLGVSYSM